MHHCRVLVPLLLSAAVLPLDTRAAASLLVDDASITDAHHCQLESWVRHTRDGQEWTAVPACTVADTEWSLGLTRLPGQPATQWAVGAKRVLVERQQRRWGLAASAGLGGTTHRPRGDDWNLTVPLTVALDAQDRVQLHLNLGWAHHAHGQGAPAASASRSRCIATGHCWPKARAMPTASAAARSACAGCCGPAPAWTCSPGACITTPTGSG